MPEKKTEKKEEQKKLNVYEKVADVKANIDGFQKDTKGYGYSYVSGSQVLYKIKDKMQEHQLLLQPSVKNASFHNVTVIEKGKPVPNFLVELEMEYTFIDATNPEDRIVVPFFAIGHQKDASMAYGTALTYSERYFLMKFFNIPTDEDDADAKTNRQKYSNEPPKIDAHKFQEIHNRADELASVYGWTSEKLKAKLGFRNSIDEPLYNELSEKIDKGWEVVRKKREEQKAKKAEEQKAKEAEEQKSKKAEEKKKDDDHKKGGEKQSLEDAVKEASKNHQSPKEKTEIDDDGYYGEEDELYNLPADIGHEDAGDRV